MPGARCSGEAPAWDSPVGREGLGRVSPTTSLMGVGFGPLPSSFSLSLPSMDLKMALSARVRQLSIGDG